MILANAVTPLNMRAIVKHNTSVSLNIIRKVQVTSQCEHSTFMISTWNNTQRQLRRSPRRESNNSNKTIWRCAHIGLKKIQHIICHLATFQAYVPLCPWEFSASRSLTPGRRTWWHTNLCLWMKTFPSSLGLIP